MEECFICTESVPEPRKSACLCTNLFVHDACLKKWLESRSATCPVCATPYTNVGSRVVGIRCDSMGGWGCVLLLASIALVVCAVHTYAILGCKRLSGATLVAVWTAAVLMTVVGLVLMFVLARCVVLHGVKVIAQSLLRRQLTIRNVQNVRNVQTIHNVQNMHNENLPI